MDSKELIGSGNSEAKQNHEQGLYGIDVLESLESVNFATAENPYLNEHFRSEDDR